MMTQLVTELVSLEKEQCFDLLATETLGRFGVVVNGIPLITPVNYVLDGATIIFRTAPGTKYDASLRSKVTFEVDHVNADGRTGWSVLIVGSVDRNGMSIDERERAEQITINTLVSGAKPILTRIVPEQVTGRRVAYTN